MIDFDMVLEIGWKRVLKIKLKQGHKPPFIELIKIL